jgi:hypothetical protein
MIEVGLPLIPDVSPLDLGLGVAFEFSLSTTARTGLLFGLNSDY